METGGERVPDRVTENAEKPGPRADALETIEIEQVLERHLTGRGARRAARRGVDGGGSPRRRQDPAGDALRAHAECDERLRPRRLEEVAHSHDVARGVGEGDDLRKRVPRG